MIEKLKEFKRGVNLNIVLLLLVGLLAIFLFINAAMYMLNL